jgi:thiopeptide-type bacteriocin biosynthesis protein
MVDIAYGFLGGRDEAMRWLVSRPAPVGSAIDRAVADQVAELVRRGGFHGLDGSGGEVDDAWHARTSALAAYRRSLSAGTDLDAVLDALLHMHHNRALGIDRDQERACRRLARQAALAWTAQQEATTP